MPNTHGTHWIRRERRLRIYARDGWRCLWCGRGIWQGAALTLDHFLPRERGGSNAPENLLTACHLCNSTRRHEHAMIFAWRCEGSLFGGWAALLDRLIEAMARPLPRVVP